MSPSEIAFLGLGLVIGSVAGALLLLADRLRPGRRRRVRITVTPNSIPARQAPRPAGPTNPAAASPAAAARAAGAAQADREIPAAAAPPGLDATRAVPVMDRTAVPTASAAVPAGAAPPQAAAPTLAAPPPGPATRPGLVTSRALAGPPVRPAEHAPVRALAGAGNGSGPGLPLRGTERPDARLPAPSTLVVDLPAASAALARLPGTLARPEDAAPSTAARGSGSSPGDGPRPVPPPLAAAGAASDRCAGLRAAVAERSRAAEAARATARDASARWQEARDTVDALQARVDRAAATTDAREVARRRADLHAAFRRAGELGSAPEEAERAARDWLARVDALEASVADARRVVATGEADLRERRAELDRLARASEEASVAADAAEEAARSASARLAECEAQGREPGAGDRNHASAPGSPIGTPPGGPATASAGTGDGPGRSPALAPSRHPEGQPAVLRMLTGDRDALAGVAAAMGGHDPLAAGAWRLRLARLVDAIVLRAIDDAWLDLPDDDPFWHLFNPAERRDVAAALSALGFRFDGLGGFVDGRVPAARDLSLAVGYAGLDRMRIRTWPPESGLAQLYAGATVDAAGWLVHQAPELDRERLVDALGRRGAGLDDAWNAWDRLRPALLAAAEPD